MLQCLRVCAFGESTCFECQHLHYLPVQQSKASLALSFSATNVLNYGSWRCSSATDWALDVVTQFNKMNPNDTAVTQSSKFSLGQLSSHSPSLFFLGGGEAATPVIYMGSLPLLSQFIDEVPGKCLAFRLYLSLT